MSACIPNVNVPLNPENIASTNLEIKVEEAQNADNNNTIDIQELASLLQCLGFSLRSFEKPADAASPCDDNNEDYLEIYITCTKSQMKASLLKQKAGCKCPSKEDASNAQFWNISACSPSLPGNLTVSKSSLIPAISVDKFQEINSLLLKALSIINEKDNKNTENFTDLLKTSTTLARPKSLESLKNESRDEGSVVRALSPTKTSSPILDSFNSSKSISIDSDKASKLLETFRAAEKILVDAFNLSGRNSTFTKRVRKTSDLKISPLASEDQKSGNSSSLLYPNKPDSSSCKATPRKIVGKKLIPGDKRKLLGPPSKIGVLKSLSPSPSRLLALKKEATPRSVIYKEKPKKSNDSTLKTKATTKTDTLIKSRVPSKIASFTSSKN